MDELAGNLDAVLDASERIGIPQAASDVEKANLLLADYGLRWLLEAIRRAGNGQATARSWRYVEGILRKWRENGCMDGDVLPTALAADEEAERKRREDARTLARLRGELPQ